MGKSHLMNVLYFLKSFGRVEPNKFDKYIQYDYEFVVEGVDIWKKMMTYVIENNKSILFG